MSIRPTPQSDLRQSPIIIGSARFTEIAPECIRIEYSECGKFIDARSMFAANRNLAFGNVEIARQDKETVIDTGKIRLVYTPDDMPFTPRNLRATIRKDRGIVTWTPGEVNSQNLGGTIQSLDGVAGPVGLGEGLLARDGWYLLDDSRGYLLTDDWVVPRPKDSGTDWYLFGYGTDYKAALRALALIGGAVPMPRKYVLGAWYSRYWPYTSIEYRQIVEEYRQHDFPLDVVALDMDWHREGWTGWSWNRALLPDAETLLTWLHEQKLFVTLNVHPADGVRAHEDMYGAFTKDMERDPLTKEELPFDAADKRYVDTLFKHMHEPLENVGVDFWWLDWQQYSNTRSLPGLTNLAWLNQYYYSHSSRDKQRGLLLSRWAGWGDHRHPIHFSGDTYTNFATLAFEVPFTSTAGNVGCCFWSHDIGGHQGPRNAETYVRWVQFGATSAVLRLHSGRQQDLDRRPWCYGAIAEESMRRSFHLRSVLFPYIYSSASQCHYCSLPLIRPTYLEHPTDEKAYRNPQQYFFGDALLVAPITTAGLGPTKVAVQAVWFPEGYWYNWFTGEKKSAGNAIVAADIEEFPLFVKGGIPIPTQPYTQRMTTSSLRDLIIRCFPGKGGSYTLYEDDGITQDYTNGQFATTKLCYERKGDTISITVGATEGSYKGQVSRRSYTVELPCTRMAETAEIDGTPANVDYDEKTSTNRIRVPDRSIRDVLKVTLEVADENPLVLRDRAVARRIERIMGEGAPVTSLKDIVLAGKDFVDIGALLAICGVTVHPKNEGIYLFEGPRTLYVANEFGIIDDDTLFVTLEDVIGGHKRVSFSREFKVAGPQALALTEIPYTQRLAETDLRSEVHLEFKVNGESLRVSKTLD